MKKGLQQKTVVNRLKAGDTLRLSGIYSADSTLDSDGSHVAGHVVMSLVGWLIEFPKCLFGEQAGKVFTLKAKR